MRDLFRRVSRLAVALLIVVAVAFVVVATPQAIGAKASYVVLSGSMARR